MANKYTNIDLSKYSKGYQASSKVNDAWNKKQKAEDAVSNYGDFNYSNQSAYQSVINDILNRKDFSYDMNADALYQQYKNQYQALGELAMQDTVGQVSALTGGYGNSYAATAGSQAYQSYLNQLNDKIPELWSLARSAYENDRAADYDKYGMLSADRQTQYGEWTDGLNRLLNERGYYSDNYNNLYNQDYTKWSDNRSYDTSQYWNEYNAGYQAERDAIADEQWKASYDYQVERDKVSDSHVVSAQGNSEQKIPDYVLEKVKTIGNDSDLEKYLDDLVASSAITESQADGLYANYKTGVIPYANRDWSVTDDGGLNWFWGLDNNAVLSDGNGTSFTAKELRDVLMNEGMTETEANAYLRNLGVYS